MLLISLSLLFGPSLNDAFGESLVIPPRDSAQWAFAIIVAYIVGASMQAIGEHVVVRAIDLTRHIQPGWRVGDIEPTDAFVERTTEGAPFLAARSMLSAHLHFEVVRDLHEVRNLAMSIAPDRISEVYRNMYTSQLCLGSSVALLITSIIAMVCLGLDHFTSVDPQTRSFGIAWIAVFLPMAIFLLDRRFRYYGISMRIPIHIALAKMSEGSITKEGAMPMKGHRVYLAGGMRGTWQDQVKAACPGLNFSDPRTHGLTEPTEFAAWDLDHVRQSDAVFGYMSKDNPSGLGLALELGYAKALRKLTILVDEKSPQDEAFARHFAIVATTTDVTKSCLADGIAFLQSLDR